MGENKYITYSRKVKNARRSNNEVYGEVRVFKGLISKHTARENSSTLADVIMHQCTVIDLLSEILEELINEKINGC